MFLFLGGHSKGLKDKVVWWMQHNCRWFGENILYMTNDKVNRARHYQLVNLGEGHYGVFLYYLGKFFFLMLVIPCK